MKRDLYTAAVFTMGLVAAMNATAATENAQVSAQMPVASNRDATKFGVYAGVLGDPSPTILGLNAAYNLTDYMRVSAGLGTLSVSAGDYEASATTVGVGAKFMVPGWSLTPTVGIHGASVFYKGEGLEVGGFESNGSHLYGSVGLDWQAKGGFNIGAGMNQSFRSGIGSSGYVNIGYFFDLADI